MKGFFPLLLLAVVALAGCSKNDNEKTEQSPLPFTAAVKNGDWMVTYMVNNASMDMGVTFLKFNANGSVVATKDGAPYNGTWTETNTAGTNTLTLNVTTSDVKLQRVNATWKVLNISEYYIDLKDPAAGSNIAVQLMKH
jgi:hypothetical protein